MTNREQPVIPLTGEWGEEVFSRLSWFRRDKVKNARILVVGCGALGNEVLKDLVLFGFEHLVLVDFDTVEASNLCRSILFTQADSARHRYKVDAAAERLKQINPEIEITAIKGDIAHEVGLALIRSMDLAIGCVDNRYARYCLNRLCMRAGIPWIDGGIDQLEGTARVFMPGKNCYACSLGEEGLKELSRRMPCSTIIQKNEAAGRAPTTPVIASIIAAVQVQEALKLVHREELEKGLFTSLVGKMFYYEGQRLSTRLVTFEAYDDDCPNHEFWAPVCHPSSLSVDMTVGQALAVLSEKLHMHHPQICLRDFCFVDHLTDRSTDERITVMQPSYRVADYLEADERLRQYSTTRFYQHEITTLTAAFPYPEMTLRQIGIPEQDIFKVKDEGREMYISL